MSEEKKLILKMFKEGKISEEEAIDLLSSVGENKTKSKINDNFDDAGEKIENSVNKFVNKIFNGIELAFNKVGDALDESDFKNNKFNFTFNNTNAQTILKNKIENIENKINLFINNKNGKTEIEPWNENHIEIESEINFNDKHLDSNSNFITEKKKDNNYFIGVNQELNASHFNVTFRIKTPYNAISNLKIESTNGKIVANYLELNDLETSTTNGKTIFEGLVANNVNSTTTNGKIEINDINANELKLKTTNSKIDIDDINANYVETITTNGKLELIKINTKVLKGKNSNGSIHVLLAKDEIKNIDLKSSNGGIYLENLNYKRPIEAVLKARDKNSLSNIFTHIEKNGNLTIARTENYDSDAENKLNINLATTNGRISLI